MAIFKDGLSDDERQPIYSYSLGFGALEMMIDPIRTDTTTKNQTARINTDGEERKTRNGTESKMNAMRNE
ncbi:unnamed protein product [Wuchereria bancrofti]|uniref:Uncharacterized protein n=1 Tax=Wuchereria bancrofti TaxID=6293 RepID=A0A3P7FHV9_WUCBA|nr:unnamed protein product [Wuchereria bancrofti]